MATDQNNDNNAPPADPSRRNLLKNAGLVGAAVAGSTAAASVIARDLPPQTAAAPAREALETLTGAEAETLEALCDCLIPSDEHGPGAREARAVHYVDRSLAAHHAAARDSYRVSLAAIDDYARRTRGKSFHQLIRDQQNSILLAVQDGKVPGCAPSAGAFFDLVRNHTIEGTFSDPYYGGNRNFSGWDMIRYPGVRLGVSDAEVRQGAELEPSHRSAYEHAGYTKTAGRMASDSATAADND